MAARSLVIALVLGAAVIAGLVAVLLAPRPIAPAVDAAPGSDAAPAPRWVAPAALPPSSAPATRAGVAGRVDPDWVAAVSERSGIPPRVLAAYAGTAIAKHGDDPACGLGWNTLAGIGWVESRHGTYRGASTADDGTVSPPIIGIALDGGSTARIDDTDGGALDGDAQFDRAVGPLQFIPGSWANWAVDGSGDGVADPHNVDDASLAAANYLCRAVPTLADEASWRAGIAAYNSDPAYLDAVAIAAQRYAEAAVAAQGP
jgi:membrane-bound lytic murein transglycosylase B